MNVLQEYFSNFIKLLNTIQLADVLDILLVTFLVYQLIKLVRTSRTGRILKAVGVLLVVFWLTQLAELHVLNFLLSAVLELGLISLVVLFQPELRRTVERLGSTSVKELLSPREKSREMDLVISRVVSACETMSRERVGALIVFERSVHLDEYFKTGTIVDARVSSELIRNIFFTNAALHDGAMVIKAGRLAAAGCVLPLTENRTLSSDLGTRHRAGIGVSEVTDAVVVIVSEETGAISVATGGMLKRHLAPQTLEKLLINELNPETGSTASRNAFWNKKRVGKDDEHEK